MIKIEKLLEIAKKAAYQAGEIQLSFMGKEKGIKYKSNEFDLVTMADKQSEEKILSILQAEFPDHNYLGEEGGIQQEKDSEYLWIIDPLDGTTNFSHNFPHFAVSIGLMKNNKPYLGVVYDVCKNELFWAGKGVGAFLNDKKIEVTTTDQLKKTLLATGFPYLREATLEENFVYFKEFIHKCQAVRRPGAAALDLCYVASGRLDGFWEMNLSSWDVAAGACIVEEAGGKVTNFYSEDFDVYTKDIIASNSYVHADMKKVIHECKKNMT